MDGDGRTEGKNGKEIRFTAEGREVAVFPAAAEDRPVLYLNTFPGEGEAVLRLLQSRGAAELTLVAISGLSWNRDLTPWAGPPVFRNGEVYDGGGAAFLRLLTETVVPEAEAALSGRIPWRGIAGYSLAGMFALYAGLQTTLFSRIASMSGSFWYPGFSDFVFAHGENPALRHLYLSLGDLEDRTRNPYLKTVRTQTEAIAAFYQEKGTDTVLFLERGNHFQNATERTAAGIAWLLGRDDRHSARS